MKRKAGQRNVSSASALRAIFGTHGVSARSAEAEDTRKSKGESIRVFPLSNWTELDVWTYVEREDIAVVPLYFAAERPTVERDGLILLVDDERFRLGEGEEPQQRRIRFRTLGCYPLSGAIESSAVSVAEIIAEMRQSTVSERQGRAIDHDQSASMERKKQEGYF
jgi:sulfate adenylyltransferase subunit 2